jgi:hypothetical protein
LIYQFGEIFKHEADERGDVANHIESAKDDKCVEFFVVFFDFDCDIFDIFQRNVDGKIDFGELLNLVENAYSIFLLWGYCIRIDILNKDSSLS